MLYIPWRCCHAGSLNLFPSPPALYTPRCAALNNNNYYCHVLRELAAKFNGCTFAFYRRPASPRARTFCTSARLSGRAHLLLILEILFVVQLTASKMCRDMSLTDLVNVLAFSAARSGARSTSNILRTRFCVSFHQKVLQRYLMKYAN